MYEKIILSEYSLDELAEMISEKLQGKIIVNPATSSQNRYIGINELCRDYHMAKPTVYALTSKREIPFIKRGKRLLFERGKIEEWLAEGCKKTMNDIKDEFESEN